MTTRASRAIQRFYNTPPHGIQENEYTVPRFCPLVLSSKEAATRSTVGFEVITTLSLDGFLSHR